MAPQSKPLPKAASEPPQAPQEEEDDLAAIIARCAALTANKPESFFTENTHDWSQRRLPKKPVEHKPNIKRAEQAKLLDRFKDDHHVADTEWVLYTVRKIPWLKIWPQVLIRRRYSRKIWRMAIAASLARWEGQIKDCRRAFCIGMADKLAQGRHADPRLDATYRVVFECPESIKIAGVGAFTLDALKARAEAEKAV